MSEQVKKTIIAERRAEAAKAARRYFSARAVMMAAAPADVPAAMLEAVRAADAFKAAREAAAISL